MGSLYDHWDSVEPARGAWQPVMRFMDMISGRGCEYFSSTVWHAVSLTGRRPVATSCFCAAGGCLQACPFSEPAHFSHPVRQVADTSRRIRMPGTWVGALVLTGIGGHAGLPAMPTKSYVGPSALTIQRHRRSVEGQALGGCLE